MDDEEELLSGRRARRRWLIALSFVALLAAAGVGALFVRDQQQQRQEAATVDQVTGAAFGCIASVRGDAPETWSLERALEHMSTMKQLTRDRSDPSIRIERERFARLAADAARGCEQLGRLMMRARAQSPDLYFAVPAVLAQPPDQENPEPWFRRVLPDERADAVELTRLIRVMAETLNARRSEHALMAAELPIEGHGPDELARIIELSPVTGPSARAVTEAWPTEAAVVVLRRGSIDSVPCQTRFEHPESCYTEVTQRIAWDGAVGPQRTLDRPAEVLYWAAFAPDAGGSMWAVGVTLEETAVVGRYPADGSAPQLTAVEAPIDADANVVAVIGGVALFPSDGSAWFASDEGPPSFHRVETTPSPLVLRTRHGGAGRGIQIPDGDRLSVTGSSRDGFTSRVTSPGGEEDVLRRMIDAHLRVQGIADLRALRSGQTVALLERSSDAPDAIAISTDFGRTWLSDASGDRAP